MFGAARILREGLATAPLSLPRARSGAFQALALRDQQQSASDVERRGVEEQLVRSACGWMRHWLACCSAQHNVQEVHPAPHACAAQLGIGRAVCLPATAAGQRA